MVSALLTHLCFIHYVLGRSVPGTAAKKGHSLLMLLPAWATLMNAAKGGLVFPGKTSHGRSVVVETWDTPRPEWAPGFLSLPNSPCTNSSWEDPQIWYLFPPDKLHFVLRYIAGVVVTVSL